MAENRSLEPYRPYLASDLEWVIYSPPLLAKRCLPDLSALPENKEILDRVCRDPSELLSFLSGMKRHNLGTYFEYLVFFWLQQLNSVEILGTNLQVQNQTRTLGEFDILFSYENVPYHWELAVKFYVNIGDGLDEALWVGTQKRDNLGKKLDRLFNHQLKLGSQKESAPLLSHHKINQIKAYPFVKGVLFERHSKTSHRSVLPERISPECSVSHWSSLEELEEEFLRETPYYQRLYKPRWISRVYAGDWLETGTVKSFKTALQCLFSENPSPVLIAFGKETLSGISEYSRIFVMPDTWID